MSMERSDIERLTRVEVLQDAHEERHERHEQELGRQFKAITERFESGEKRFDNVDTQLVGVTKILTEHCVQTGCGPKPSNHRKRDIVIKLGPPVAGGGGLIAIVAWLVAHFAG